MATIQLVRQLGSLFEDGSASGLSDRQLLERFTAKGEPADEAAFSAIVARHGTMVLGVCRQLLGDHHEAEDAFQATFFVLARQARHHQVEQHDVGRAPRGQARHGRVAAFRMGDGEALALQHRLDEAALGRVVVHDKDRLGHSKTPT